MFSRSSVNRVIVSTLSGDLVKRPRQLTVTDMSSVTTTHFSTNSALFSSLRTRNATKRPVASFSTTFRQHAAGEKLFSMSWSEMTPFNDMSGLHCLWAQCSKIVFSFSSMTFRRVSCSYRAAFASLWQVLISKRANSETFLERILRRGPTFLWQFVSSCHWWCE